jgi:hypothetical protein
VKNNSFVPLRHVKPQPEFVDSPIQGKVAIYDFEAIKRQLEKDVISEMAAMTLKKPVSEMITTSQGAMALLEKVRIDVDFGLAQVPLLYGPVYENIAGPFPGGVVQINENTLQANVVFLERFEGGEVIFGTLQTGAPSAVTITQYAAGFEWTEDMIEFDKTWDITLNNRAFGRAYNYLLNHLHLSPIISYSYAGGNTTGADATAGQDIYGHTLNTFANAYKTAVLATPQRTPSVVLANEADRFQIEQALLQPVRDSQGNPLPRVPIDTIIYYNGATVTNGLKSYVYAGVTQGTAYFIFPQQRFKELVHHDLRIDIGPPDISRLVEGQQVGRTRRGVYADMANSVQKLTLPVS